MKLFTNKYKTIFIIMLVLIIIVSFAYWLWARNRVSTDDAYVDGHVFVITPRISGYVSQVQIDDNQFVKKDQPLVSLDSTDYEVALAQAEAQLSDSRATLASLELGVPLQLAQTAEQVRGAKAELQSLRETLEQIQRDEDAAAQEVNRLQAQYHLAELDFKRKTILRKGEAISQQTMDEAETNYKSVLAQLRNAQAKLESVKKQKASQASNIELKQSHIALAKTGSKEAEIKSRQVEAQKSKVRLAETQVRQAKLNLSYTKILSPVDGYVTQKNIEPSQFVTPGQRLLEIVPLQPPNVWITANFKETQLTDVRPGQSVSIEVDTYPGVVIRGKVDSIMTGTGSVFSLLPPENATGNFVKVVQRIPVKITIDEPNVSAIPVLRLGMSVIPTIYVGKK
ncbi:MAG: HlyD family secretion protein [Desulfomonilaceae bacterium]